MDHIIVDRERVTVIPVPEGALVMAVHEWDECRGRECVVHAPTDHSMRKLPLLWRGDRGIFERLCPHGVGHPDPDQWVYFHEQAYADEDPGEHADAMMTHGCCEGFCCAPTPAAAARAGVRA